MGWALSGILAGGPFVVGGKSEDFSNRAGGGRQLIELKFMEMESLRGIRFGFLWYGK